MKSLYRSVITQTGEDDPDRFLLARNAEVRSRVVALVTHHIKKSIKNPETWQGHLHKKQAVNHNASSRTDFLVFPGTFYATMY